MLCRFDICSVSLVRHIRVYFSKLNYSLGIKVMKYLLFCYFLVFAVPPTFPSTLPTPKQIRDENQTMSYSCTAEAKPAARILSVLNGQNLPLIPPYNITASFQIIPNSKLFRTFGYLIMKRLTWRQYGNFSCIAYNDAGRTRQNTELEVRCKYLILTSQQLP